MDKFLIAQIFGACALISSIVGVCQKTRNKYIVFNIIQNVFSGFQYLLLGKNIAFYLCLFGIIRLIVYSFKNKINNIFDFIVLIFVISINILISLISFENFYDFIPLIASTLVCYTVWQRNITVIRWGVLTSKCLWGIYAVISRAYFSVIMDIFLIICSLMVIIRDYKKQSKK